jgi:hypothetical protein
VTDRELRDRAVRYLAASLVATDDGQCRLLANIAWTAVVELAQLRSRTSGDLVPCDAFEAVRAQVLAAVKSRVLAVTPKLVAALAGITDERAIIATYSQVLAEDLAIRQ